MEWTEAPRHQQKPVGSNQLKKDRIRAKKEARRAEKEAARYVPLAIRNPEQKKKQLEERAAKVERRIARRLEQEKTAFPRHYQRLFDASNMRLERAKQEQQS